MVVLEEHHESAGKTVILMNSECLSPIESYDKLN